MLVQEVSTRFTLANCLTHKESHRRLEYCNNTSHIASSKRQHREHASMLTPAPPSLPSRGIHLVQETIQMVPDKHTCHPKNKKHIPQKTPKRLGPSEYYAGLKVSLKPMSPTTSTKIHVGSIFGTIFTRQATRLPLKLQWAFDEGPAFPGLFWRQRSWRNWWNREF